MNSTNLTMVKGDTLAFVVDIEGLTDDLDTAYLSVKADPNAEDYVFQKSLADGITKVKTGQYRVRIAPADTKTVDLGTYFYDLQIGLDSDIYTIMRGKLEIVYEITEE